MAARPAPAPTATWLAAPVKVATAGEAPVHEAAPTPLALATPLLPQTAAAGVEEEEAALEVQPTHPVELAAEPVTPAEKAEELGVLETEVPSAHEDHPSVEVEVV